MKTVKFSSTPDAFLWVHASEWITFGRTSEWPMNYSGHFCRSICPVYPWSKCCFLYTLTYSPDKYVLHTYNEVDVVLTRGSAVNKTADILCVWGVGTWKCVTGWIGRWWSPKDQPGKGQIAQGWRGEGSWHNDRDAGPPAPAPREGDVFAEGYEGVHQRALHETGRLRGTRDREEGLVCSVKGVKARVPGGVS